MITRVTFAQMLIDRFFDKRNPVRAGLKSEFNLSLDQEINIPDLGGEFSQSSKAKVVGIDRYTERTAAGGNNSWVSYTLETEHSQRFWAVDGQCNTKTGEAFVPRSFYVPSNQNTPPKGFKLDRDLSGYVELQTEGDSELSGGQELDIGALFTYRNRKGEIWAEETFKGADRITFDAVFEPEGYEP